MQNQLSTSREKKNDVYREKVASAEIYGKVSVRPQDADKYLMKAQRRKNLTLNELNLPEKYIYSLHHWLTNFSLPAVRAIDLSQLIQRSTTQGLIQCHEEAVTAFFEIQQHQLIAVDFEFHERQSYDGFICTAAVSTESKNYVFDCIGECRLTVQTHLSKILEDPSIMKLLCGCDNDIGRLQKDWNCFMVGCIDIQDLFVTWRNIDYDSCLMMCEREIREKIAEKKSCPSSQVPDTDVEIYLANLNKPGFQFFVEIFYGNRVIKDEIATHADWRVRPLPLKLLKYAASDSYYVLNFFHLITRLIGVHRVSTCIASHLCFKKLTKVAKLHQYQVQDTGLLGQTILQWREYLAMNLDKSPDEIFHRNKIEELASSIQRNGSFDCKFLTTCLSRFRISEDPEKCARLLFMFLDFTQEGIQKMQNIDCHNCNRTGHPAVFCPFDGTKEDRKANRTTEKNMPFTIKQSNRRWLNWCLKKGRDPSNKPWENN